MLLDEHHNQISLHSIWLECMLHVGLQLSSMFQNLVICEIWGSHGSYNDYYCLWDIMLIRMVEVYWYFRGHTASIIIVGI